MKTLFKNVKVLAAAALAACLSVEAGGINLLEPAEDALVPLLTDVQKAYFNLPADVRRKKFVDEEFRKNFGYPAERIPGERRARRPCQPKTVRLVWEPLETASEYTVKVQDVRTGALVVDETVKGSALNIDNLEVAAKYKWTVTGGGKSASRTFKTEDMVPRFVRFPDLGNVRDIGGCIGLGGRRVKQGMVFRSIGLNANAPIVYYTEDELRAQGRTAEIEAARAKGEELKIVKEMIPGESWVQGEKGAYILKRFGIKSEIDLRTDKECFGMTGSPLGDAVKWFHIPSRDYGGMQSQRGKDAFAKVFKIFLDEKNYPIDFHCISGSDRTGSLSYILLAVLGVDEDTLAKDWEASALWARSTGFCHEKRYDKLVDGFKKNFPAATAVERVEKYILSAGFSAEDIEKFRSIMLERDLKHKSR